MSATISTSTHQQQKDERAVQSGSRERFIPSDVFLNTHAFSASHFFHVISLQHPSEVEKSHDSHFTNGNLKTGKLNSFDLDEAARLRGQRRFVVKWGGKTSCPKPQTNAQVTGPSCLSGKLLDLACGSNSFILQPIISISNAVASPGLYWGDRLWRNVNILKALEEVALA